MSWFERVRSLVTGREAFEPLRSRRDRRAAARDRHHATGEPLWTDADRHPGPAGAREVQDVAPGTPGSEASRRVIGG